MACRGFWECLLKLFNFLLTLAGLAMVGYGIYLFVEWKRASNGWNLVAGGSSEIITLGRPIMMTVPVAESILDDIPKSWFIVSFIGIGVILFVISVFGCIGLATRSGCCLSCYSLLVFLLIIVELGCAAFIFFDHSWQDVIPTDSTGDYTMIYDFIKKHWKIAKWVALGAIILESGDEYLVPRSGIRQPLINSRQPVPVTGVPVPFGPDQRGGRSDVWSTRMREKYGLDTSEFTYKPSNCRYPQQVTSLTEERSGCNVM